MITFTPAAPTHSRTKMTFKLTQQLNLKIQKHDVDSVEFKKFERSISPGLCATFQSILGIDEYREELLLPIFINYSSQSRRKQIIDEQFNRLLKIIDTQPSRDMYIKYFYSTEQTPQAKTTGREKFKLIPQFEDKPLKSELDAFKEVLGQIRTIDYTPTIDLLNLSIDQFKILIKFLPDEVKWAKLVINRDELFAQIVSDIDNVESKINKFCADLKVYENAYADRSNKSMKCLMWLLKKKPRLNAPKIQINTSIAKLNAFASEYNINKSLKYGDFNLPTSLALLEQIFSSDYIRYLKTAQERYRYLLTHSIQKRSLPYEGEPKQKQPKIETLEEAPSLEEEELERFDEIDFDQNDPIIDIDVVADRILKLYEHFQVVELVKLSTLVYQRPLHDILFFESIKKPLSLYLKAKIVLQFQSDKNFLPPSISLSNIPPFTTISPQILDEIINIHKEDTNIRCAPQIFRDYLGYFAYIESELAKTQKALDSENEYAKQYRDLLEQQKEIDEWMGEYNRDTIKSLQFGKISEILMTLSGQRQNDQVPRPSTVQANLEDFARIQVLQEQIKKLRRQKNTTTTGLKDNFIKDLWNRTNLKWANELQEELNILTKQQQELYESNNFETDEDFLQFVDNTYTKQQLIEDQRVYNEKMEALRTQTPENVSMWENLHYTASTVEPPSQKIDKYQKSLRELTAQLLLMGDMIDKLNGSGLHSAFMYMFFNMTNSDCTHYLTDSRSD